MAAGLPTLDERQGRALVTGGAAGIGWATCQALSREGVRCAIADIDRARAHERALELGPGHVGIAVDLADAEQAKGLPEAAAAQMGGLDIVVNNAGITDASGRRIEEITEADFTRLVAVNLRAVEAVCRAAQPLMTPGGAIVNVASGAAMRPIALRGAYSASKAGVVALTRALHHAFHTDGIAVSAVAPGYVRTELVDGLIREGQLDEMRAVQRIPLGRLALPADIAEAIAFLAGAGARALAGGCLVVDGGSSAAAGGEIPDAPHGETARAEPGAVVVLGTGPLAEALARRFSTYRKALQIEDPADLGGVGTIATLIDARPIKVRSACEALAEAHRLAVACGVRSFARSEGFSLQFHVLHASDCGDTSVREAALAMFVRTLSVEWGRRGFRVNAVGSDGSDADAVCDVAAFLAAPAASYVTGQHLITGVAA